VGPNIGTAHARCAPVDARFGHLGDGDGEARKQVDERDGHATKDLGHLGVGHQAGDPHAYVLEVDLQA